MFISSVFVNTRNVEKLKEIRKFYVWFWICFAHKNMKKNPLSKVGQLYLKLGATPAQADRCSIISLQIFTQSMPAYSHDFSEKWIKLSKSFQALLKVPFFRMWDSFFKSPNLPKKLFQKTILSLKFEIPAHISKQLIQISS